MKLNYLSPRPWLILIGCSVLSTAAVGCQSTIGGQTLPSAYYLRDDVQYFPPGPEFRLTRQVEALEEYKLRQQGAVEPAGGPPPANEPAPAPANP